MAASSWVVHPASASRVRAALKDAVHRQPGGIAPSPELVGEVVAAVALATRTMSSVKFVCALIVTVHSTYGALMISPDPVENGYVWGCGCEASLGRLRRSAMNWSNSALSFAKRRRCRNSLNSRCSSSSLRNVSARYSSKARLPLEGECVPHQLIPLLMLSTLLCHRPMPLWFPQPIRPLPIMKARMARPNGHHQIKLRIINAIQAGFPNSSILAAIGMARGLTMNVNNIYIAFSNCQGGARGKT